MVSVLWLIRHRCDQKVINTIAMGTLNANDKSELAEIFKSTYENVGIF